MFKFSGVYVDPGYICGMSKLNKELDIHMIRRLGNGNLKHY